jgi:hypothetical protein
MWRTVLILALLTSTDPVRLGITALLVARPRPLLNLLAFWLGGMASGVAAGVAALLTMRESLPRVIHNVTSTVAGVVHGPVQIAVGLLALLLAVRVAVKLQPQQIAAPMGAPLALAPQPTNPTMFSRLSGGVRQVLGGGNPWVAFAAGLGNATPPVEYLIALAAILASGAQAGTQVGAVVMFVVVVLAVVEIPLVSFLATPTRTQAIMEQVHTFLRDRRRLISAATIGVGGMMLVVGGMAHL